MEISRNSAADLILSHSSICVVSPPHNTTVVMTMTSVVEKSKRCCSLSVFRMASANAIAPRSPAANNNINKRGGRWHRCIARVYTCVLRIVD